MAIERTSVVLVPDRASFRRVENIIQGIGGSVDIDTARAESELRNLAQDREMDIRADLVGDEEIQSALNRLDNDRDMDIRADLEGDADIRAALNSLDDDRQVKFTTSIEGDAEIRSTLNALDDDRMVRVRAELTGDRGIRSTLNSLDNDRDVTFRADIAGDAEVRSTLNSLDDDREVKLTAVLDEGSVRSELDELSRRREAPIGGSSSDSIGGRAAAAGGEAVGRGRGAVSTIISALTLAGVDAERARQSAEISAIGRTAQQTGVDIGFLDSFLRALEVKTPVSREESIDGLKDGIERFGEEFNEKLRDPEKASEEGAGPLGQVPVEIRRALIAAESADDKLNIFLQLLNNLQGQGKTGEAGALAIAREGFGDQFAEALTAIARNPQAFREERAAQLASGRVITPEQVAQNAVFAENQRRATQERNDASRDALTSEAATTAREAFNELKTFGARLASGDFFFAGEREARGEEAVVNEVARLNENGSPVSPELQARFDSIEAGRADRESAAQRAAVDREISEVVSALDAFRLSSEQSAFSLANPAFAGADAPTPDQGLLQEAIAQAEDIKKIRELNEGTKQQNETISELLSEMVKLTREANITRGRSDFATGPLD